MPSFTVKSYLVRKLNYSNKEAKVLLESGRVQVNGEVSDASYTYHPEDEIKIDDVVVKAPTRFHYIAYYKPSGIETTQNTSIENNFLKHLDLPFEVFPVGRLDKESEGLLLLTDDGRIYRNLAESRTHKEKEYVVSVEQELTSDHLVALQQGIQILGQTTRPAKVELLDKNTFRIILTQGLNRQIRRMCYKLNLNVVKLIRVRIDAIGLNGLKEGEWRNLTESEIHQILNK